MTDNVVDLGRGNGSHKGVILQREYRVNLDRAHQEVLEAVAQFNGMSPSAWLEHAAQWGIRKAHEEISIAFLVQSVLARFPNCY